MTIPQAFDSLDADIILISCDEHNPTEFPVHRSILSAASPFFYGMFTLPQKPTADKELPCIPVSESCQTLDTLLRFVYPIQDPPISSLDELVPILAAAVKYDFLSATATLRSLLVSPCFVKKEPTRVYAIACRFDLEEEARIASRYTLNVNVLDAPLSDDLKYITAYSYHRLLDLHRRRVQAAHEILKLPGDIKCMQCNGSSFSVYAAPRWWSHYEKRRERS